MSTSHPAEHPPLRLLERPQRSPRGTAPAVKRSSSGWLARQLERFWAWGERSGHHRLGSWLRH